MQARDANERPPNRTTKKAETRRHSRKHEPESEGTNPVFDTSFFLEVEAWLRRPTEEFSMQRPRLTGPTIPHPHGGTE